VISQQNPDGTWSPAEPIGMIGWKAKTTEQLGFDPNGMCLRICRTARDIGPVYPSAVVAQNATPAAHRVYGVADVRRGMVVYYDDPNDSNPYGHIVTVVGRDRDADPDSLSSLLVRSNSVVSHERSRPS
jgi:hypothetical protein